MTLPPFLRLFGVHLIFDMLQGIIPIAFSKTGSGFSHLLQYASKNHIFFLAIYLTFMALFSGWTFACSFLFLQLKIAPGVLAQPHVRVFWNVLSTTEFETNEAFLPKIMKGQVLAAQLPTQLKFILGVVWVTFLPAFQTGFPPNVNAMYKVTSFAIYTAALTQSLTNPYHGK